MVLCSAGRVTIHGRVVSIVEPMLIGYVLSWSLTVARTMILAGIRLSGAILVRYVRRRLIVRTVDLTGVPLMIRFRTLLTVGRRRHARLMTGNVTLSGVLEVMTGIGLFR